MTKVVIARSFIGYILVSMLTRPLLNPIFDRISEGWGAGVGVAISIVVNAGIFAGMMGGLNLLGTNHPWINRAMSFGLTDSGPVFVLRGHRAASVAVPNGTGGKVETFSDQGTGALAPLTFLDKEDPSKKKKNGP